MREVERRIEGIEAYNLENPDRELPEAPIGVPDSWHEHVKLMTDLQVLAFAADVTRVSTFKWGRDTSNRVFPESGNTSPFHSASHHGNTPSGVTNFSEINRYHVELLAYFVEQLEEHTRRRRQPAGSFADPVRKRHGRFAGACPQTNALPVARARKRNSPGQSSCEDQRGDPAGQRAVVGPRTSWGLNRTTLAIVLERSPSDIGMVSRTSN